METEQSLSEIVKSLNKFIKCHNITVDKEELSDQTFYYLKMNGYEVAFITKEEYDEYKKVLGNETLL